MRTGVVSTLGFGGGGSLPAQGFGVSPRGAVRLRAPSPGLTGIPFLVLTFGAGGKRRTADLETPLRLLPQGGLGWGGPAGLRATDPPALLQSWLGAGGSLRSQPRLGSEPPAPATTSSRQRFPASASPRRPHSPPARPGRALPGPAGCRLGLAPSRRCEPRSEPRRPGRCCAPTLLPTCPITAPLWHHVPRERAEFGLTLPCPHGRRKALARVGNSDSRGISELPRHAWPPPRGALAGSQPLWRGAPAGTSSKASARWMFQPQWTQSPRDPLAQGQCSWARCWDPEGSVAAGQNLGESEGSKAAAQNVGPLGVLKHLDGMLGPSAF